MVLIIPSSSVKSTIFTLANECDMSTGFAYQNCDGTIVYTYKCSGPNCGNCKVTDKARVNTCYEGYEYQCIFNNAAAPVAL